MRFTKKKKDKIRKIRQKRIRKTYGYMVGSTIADGLRVVDQARIFDTIYLLAADHGHKYSVYQISDIRNIVKLSDKRLRKLHKYLENRDRWFNHSYIPIDLCGKLVQEKIIVL